MAVNWRKRGFPRVLSSRFSSFNFPTTDFVSASIFRVRSALLASKSAFSATKSLETHLEFSLKGDSNFAARCDPKGWPSLPSTVFWDPIWSKRGKIHFVLGHVCWNRVGGPKNSLGCPGISCFPLPYAISGTSSSSSKNKVSLNIDSPFWM